MIAIQRNHGKISTSEANSLVWALSDHFGGSFQIITYHPKAGILKHDQSLNAKELKGFLKTVGYSVQTDLRR